MSATASTSAAPAEAAVLDAASSSNGSAANGTTNHRHDADEQMTEGERGQVEADQSYPHRVLTADAICTCPLQRRQLYMTDSSDSGAL